MKKKSSEIRSGPMRKLLVSILDQIIPASSDGRIPAAGALGVADYLAEKAAGDQVLHDLFERGLARAAEIAGNEEMDEARCHSVVRQLELDDPAFFEALIRHTYMGYYSRADIRSLFGLSSAPTQPQGYDVPEDDPGELAALLEPVKRRGRCYRAV